MAEVAFPEYVEKFIEETNGFLEAFETKLGAFTEDKNREARIYQISTGDDLVELIVHRTTASLELPVGEYRCRVIATINPELAKSLRGKEGHLNRFATLGALVTTEKKVSVCCQCLIPPDLQRTVSGVLAAAIVHARPSIINGICRASNQELAPAVEQLSAWTDLDFEQLHYDYAHLGIGSLGSRRWTMQLYPYGTISLDAIHNNPYFGAGLLFLSRIPKNVLRSEAEPVDVNAMNLWGNLIFDAPTFGGWCRDESDLVFAQFFPNFMKDLPEFTELMIAWARRQLATGPELVELQQKQDEHVEPDS